VGLRDQNFKTTLGKGSIEKRLVRPRLISLVLIPLYQFRELMHVLCCIGILTDTWQRVLGDLG